jgi:hypothetical protein
LLDLQDDVASKISNPCAQEQPYADLVDAEAVMEALLLKRAELDEAAPHGEVDFHVVLRGGKWTFENTGKEYDSLRAEASNKDAEQWCVRVGLNKSFTASLAGHGEATASLLCRAWASKMQFLYDSCGGDGGHLGEVAGGDSAVFVEDASVADCYSTEVLAVRTRILQIRALHVRGGEALGKSVVQCVVVSIVLIRFGISQEISQEPSQ